MEIINELNERGQNDVDREMKSEEQQNANFQKKTIQVNWDLLNDRSVPIYPNHINETKDFIDDFLKQFQDVISKQLKKKLKPIQGLSDLQRHFA